MPITRPANNTHPIIVNGDLDEDIVVGPNNLAPIQISGNCNSRVTIGANNCAAFSLGGDNLGLINFGVNNLGIVDIVGNQGQITFGQIGIGVGSQAGGGQTTPASSGPSPEEINAATEVFDRIQALLDSNPILFDTGSATIRSDQAVKINRIVSLLKEMPQSIQVEVSGHTDNTGTPDGNQVLSQKRAESVFSNLVAQGIPENQLIAKGYGQARPIASNTTTEGRRKNRRIDFAIAPSEPKREFGGDLKGKKTILIAWTFDDGPHQLTNKLSLKLGIKNVTWFIVKSNMLKGNKWHEHIARYRKYQDMGGEVALHAQHKTIDHILWFPAKKGADYDCYDSIEIAMAELKIFKEELEKDGIKTKFTRLPGGLISQLADYARHYGLVMKTNGKSDNGMKAARAVINGNSFNSLGFTGSSAEIAALKTGFTKIVSDFATFKKSLKAMGVLLWGNTKKPSEIVPQSWEAESSGTLRLEDNITRAVTLKKLRDKRAGGSYRAGKFERLADRVKVGETTRSFIVLSHDTSDAYIEAIVEDKKTMEAYARKKGVKIEYVTMSTLFGRVTGEDAATFEPDY